ncbi:MAG: ferritin-like domain-containing protein [Bdellovibrionales bacterium]|nr:ferritin-like domain-containing protein [Bdellovibrionales bacterium]
MKQVDELIRGELAAIKSFDAVLPKIKDTNEKQKLSEMRMDHVKAVDSLKRFVRNFDEKNVDTAGPWGAFATAFAGGASFFGDKVSIKALKMGEEHGIQEYREAIEDGSIDPNLKRVIQTELLPQQQQHLSVINGYLQ